MARLGLITRCVVVMFFKAEASEILNEDPKKISLNGVVRSFFG
jgi:hypothetical protein